MPYRIARIELPASQIDVVRRRDRSERHVLHVQQAVHGKRTRIKGCASWRSPKSHGLRLAVQQIVQRCGRHDGWLIVGPSCRSAWTGIEWLQTRRHGMLILNIPAGGRGRSCLDRRRAIRSEWGISVSGPLGPSSHARVPIAGGRSRGHLPSPNVRDRGGWQAAVTIGRILHLSRTIG